MTDSGSVENRAAPLTMSSTDTDDVTGPVSMTGRNAAGAALAGTPAPRQVRVVAYGVFLGLLALCFVRHLTALFGSVTNSDLNSYIVLVPFVSAYLVFLNRPRLPLAAR